MGRLVTSGNSTGDLKMWTNETVPTGWLECDGSSLSQTTYAALFAVVGTRYGTAGAGLFNLPDFRGKFPRGWDHGAAIDPDAAGRTANATGGLTGNVVGSQQADQYTNHGHTQNYAQNTGGGSVFVAGVTSNNVSVASGHSTGGSGGNETRPKNLNTMFIIKY